METGADFSILIAAISFLVFLTSLVSRLKTAILSKKLTITKKDGSELTVNVKYNRSDSKKMLDFIHD